MQAKVFARLAPTRTIFLEIRPFAPSGGQHLVHFADQFPQVDGLGKHLGVLGRLQDPRSGPQRQSR